MRLNQAAASISPSSISIHQSIRPSSTICETDKRYTVSEERSLRDDRFTIVEFDEFPTLPVFLERNPLQVLRCDSCSLL